MPGEIRFSKVARMLKDKGYALVRISGSHHVFARPGSLPVVIPVHGGKVKPFYVKQIEKL